MPYLWYHSSRYGLWLPLLDPTCDPRHGMNCQQPHGRRRTTTTNGRPHSNSFRGGTQSCEIPPRPELNNAEKRDKAAKPRQANGRILPRTSLRSSPQNQTKLKSLYRRPNAAHCLQYWGLARHYGWQAKLQCVTCASRPSSYRSSQNYFPRSTDSARSQWNYMLN